MSTWVGPTTICHVDRKRGHLVVYDIETGRELYRLPIKNMKGA